MSELLADLKALTDPTPGANTPDAPNPGKSRHNHKPDATIENFDGERGEMEIGGGNPDDWNDVLAMALPPSFNSEDYQLVGNPRMTSHVVRTEDRYDENGALIAAADWDNVQIWWKIQFARKDIIEAEKKDDDAERLHDELTNWKLPKKRKPLEGESAFVINLADWQIGQFDDGGTAYTVARIKEVYVGIQQRIRTLKKLGVPLGTAYVAGLGDLVEGCSGFYAIQTFTVDANRREQVNIVRRMVVKLLKMLVQEGFDQIVVVAVGGNHGEHRQDGKAFTDLSDNDDVSVFDQTYDIISETPYADKFLWNIPKEELVVTAQVCDRIIGWTHGHMAKVSGATPQKKLQNWWAQQAMGGRIAGDASLLVTGHYHHFSVVEDEHRTHLQTPAMCGTSKWWEGMTGQGSVPGTVTFVVQPGMERPFTHLEIVSPFMDGVQPFVTRNTKQLVSNH